MSWLSRMLGRKNTDADTDFGVIFSEMTKILDDEEYQIEMLPEPVLAFMRSRGACDEREGATGEFGLSAGNPIPANGPIGELAYLSNLRTSGGEALFFHRIGSQATIDVFEAVSMSGSEWFIFFMDMYYLRRSRKAPAGLTFSSHPSQFSGFTKFCRNFPYDFLETKLKGSDSIESFAYIPLSTALPHIDRGSFERPLSHRAKLDIVRGALSAIST